MTTYKMFKSVPADGGKPVWTINIKSSDVHLITKVQEDVTTRIPHNAQLQFTAREAE